MKEFYASIFDTNDQRRSPQPSSTLAKSDTMYPHEERTITPQLAELFQHSSFPSCEEEMSNTFDRTRGRFWQSIIMLKMCWQNRKRVWRHNQTRKFSVTNLILAALCTRSPSFYKTKASNNSYQSWFKIKKKWGPLMTTWISLSGQDRQSSWFPGLRFIHCSILGRYAFASSALVQKVSSYRYILLILFSNLYDWF